MCYCVHIPPHPDEMGKEMNQCIRIAPQFAINHDMPFWWRIYRNLCMGRNKNMDFCKIRKKFYPCVRDFKFLRFVGDMPIIYFHPDLFFGIPLYSKFWFQKEHIDMKTYTDIIGIITRPEWTIIILWFKPFPLRPTPPPPQSPHFIEAPELNYSRRTTQIDTSDFLTHRHGQGW